MTDLMSARRSFLFGGTALLLSGCNVGPEIEPPEADLPLQFLPGATQSSLLKENDHWWTNFRDPVLDQIVEAGLEQNLDIRRAVARIKQAEGLADAAGYPISGSVRVGEAKIDDASGSGNKVGSGFVRAEASWRLDLFGELENERLAGSANLDAAYEDANIWRLTLISDLISAYVDLRYSQELIRITKRINQTRRVTLQETRKLVADGKASEIEEAQAQSLLATSRATLPELEILFVTNLNRIMVLLGVTDLPSRRDLDVTAPQPLPYSTVVQTGVPADLVRNRPDIRRAERRVVSALATVGVAEAEMYPGLVLTGNITRRKSSTEPSINAGFLRVGFDLPIFDRPVRKGRREAARGVAEERRLEWEKEVVFAVEEVRNAMIAMEKHQRAIKHASISLDAAEKVLEIARREFTAGNMDFFQVQDAERTFLSAENSLALDRRNLAIDYVKLNVALGGSYGSVRLGS